MDPQAFVRLSIGSLGLRIANTAASKASRTEIHSSSFSDKCLCVIRLRGFSIQTATVPFIPYSQATPDPHSISSSFYLEESDVKGLLTPTCFQFQATHSHLEISVFTERPGLHCGVSGRKQQIGTFRLQVSPEWGEGKSVLLQNGWVGIGKNKMMELHLKVKLDPDPRYVFQFEDETTLSPQVVQLQGNIKQPIFSCKFSRDRRTSKVDRMSFADDMNDQEMERKGWRVMIHDLSGSAIAAAIMATPFVPSTGCDRVARSNPGAWLILWPEGWHRWGCLEAWRDRGGNRDLVCCRLQLVSECDDDGFVVSEVSISADKGGEFLIDMDRAVQENKKAKCYEGCGEGFVMKCRMNGEGKSRKPMVQLAVRHVTCVEDAAIFIALAAAVDLSIEACRPFRRKTKKGSRHLSTLHIKDSRSLTV